jgi:hypothetical protein
MARRRNGRYNPADDPAGDPVCVERFKQRLIDEGLRPIADNLYVTCHEG